MEIQSFAGMSMFCMHVCVCVCVCVYVLDLETDCVTGKTFKMK